MLKRASTAGSVVSGLTRGSNSTSTSANSGVSEGTFISCGQSYSSLAVVDAASYLSASAIEAAVKKYCCHEGCLLKMCVNSDKGDFSEGFGLVQQGREYLKGYDKKERRDALRTILKSHCVMEKKGRLDSNRVKYFIPVHASDRKVEICAIGFQVSSPFCYIYIYIYISTIH
jgi:hypothetical protein